MGVVGLVRKKYRIIIGCVIVIGIIITAVLIVQTQNQEVPIFSSKEYNVRLYPYYFRTAFEVSDHPALEAYLRIQMECQDLSNVDGTWFNFMLFRGNVSVLDTYHDPDNSTVRWLMSEDGLALRHSGGTVITPYDEVKDSILIPGEYVWVHFTSLENITARVLSVTLSIVYLD
jgi:hypothetical protein